MTPRTGGLADTSLSSGELLVQASARGGENVIESFSDDDYMVQADASTNMNEAKVWVRYIGSNNGYRFRFYLNVGQGYHVHLHTFDNGESTLIGSGTYTPSGGPAGTIAVKIKLSGSSIKCWIDGSLKINVTDSTHAAGGVALGGYAPKFDNLKIGYDGNGDDDPSARSPHAHLLRAGRGPDASIPARFTDGGPLPFTAFTNDAGDDLVMDENFGSTSVTAVYDKAGNLIDDGELIYQYDAWHRLVKVRAKLDDVTVQTAEFDAMGRRIRKTVTYSGDYDQTVVYLL